MIRMVRQSDQADEMDGQMPFPFGSVRRFLMKKRDIPSWDREKVRKTLMEYMTTRVVMRPVGIKQKKRRPPRP